MQSVWRLVLLLYVVAVALLGGPFESMPRGKRWPIRVYVMLLVVGLVIASATWVAKRHTAA
jgi:uncharacterized membrane protein YhhN